MTVPRGRARQSAPPTAMPGQAIDALTPHALKALRRESVRALPRRALLRRSLGIAVGLVATEALAGTIGFLWPRGAGAGGRIEVGTLDDLKATAPGLPLSEGFPAYVPEARAFVTIVDPSSPEFVPGTDETGTGRVVNVIALSQRCPHLGCRPNPCLEDFWFHCPCHQSRYDRLGIKVAGERYGPAARGMDRFKVIVDADRRLIIDTSRLLMGPLPIALGQPGVIPPRVPNGCR